MTRVDSGAYEILKRWKQTDRKGRNTGEKRGKERRLRNRKTPRMHHYMKVLQVVSVTIASKEFVLD
jgi:hypothetical protein